MENELQIREKLIAQKIHDIRGKKVMLSGDLGELYEVEVKVLNQQVKRNIKRFPDRYMFQLTSEEYKEILRSQNVTLKRGRHSKYPPYAFTEHGILMLSSILRSEKAEKVNVLIIDTFVKLREMMSTQTGLIEKLRELELHITSHDSQIVVLFEHLRMLLEEKAEQKAQQSRKLIGFKKKQ